MKSSTFQHELIQTSSVFGRKSDVDVVFTGDQACTDGKKIILPAIDIASDINQETAMVMRGYVDHEAAHVRETTMSTIRRANNQAEKDGDKLLPTLLNCVEDIRIERNVIKQYPGALKNLRATT